MSDPSAARSGSLPVIPPLLAVAMRPLPLLPLQLILSGVLQRILQRNPAIFDRLGEHSRARFGIEPTDLPFSFVVEASPPRLGVVHVLPRDLDARIRTSLASLLALLEGKVDGDALMFSRDLVIEGNVEAILALRNAIDDAQLDLVEELSSLFGPLGRPARRALAMARERVLGASHRHGGF
ncbi:SCP2 domain-containing protein [Bradyrhizobium liaoningense]|uniref:ubiquinone anaerobic biosynthesis accessory factor UbiT n=1 Tax=Bradyrhizobium liaoningense TaxID=43992 RepID=UPI001BAA7400|nr:SCP2 sterol-binding domain-containing protein [Bradyrhizobium liaoningense]MBR0714965.1 SCP2 sterol-binding domain-containing protein [Bradyrhizobium liaoningense]